MLNTNAETAHYIQDALVDKVYTSAKKAVLAQASACQVSGHTSAWVTQVYVYAWAIAQLAHATPRLVLKPVWSCHEQ